MYFNENKYKRCIGHLIAIKASIVISYLVIFALIGAAIGYPIMIATNEEYTVMIISAVVGAVVGLLIGLFSTWKIEMKIQESYWRIDMLNELKKQTTMANKNTPVAKTVVAIENKQAPEKKPENKVEDKKEEN